MSAKVDVTFACATYDRMFALETGQVQVDGVNLHFLNQPVEETFWRQLRHQEFEASEMSFSSYLIARDRGVPDLIAIPVFPSRYFRHNCIFYNVDSGIQTPKDLIGKRVGVPEYQITAALWIRGILADEYGVEPNQMRWFYGGEEQPGREEKLPIAPKDVELQPIPADRTLSEMLLAGDIDAFVTARAPSSFYHPSGKVRRLFPNFQEVEEAYFKKTGIYPIMHTVALKRSFFDRYPWVAPNLVKAFEEAKALAMANLKQTAALAAMYPWLTPAIEHTIDVMGEDYWPYGVEKNRKVLETAVRYSYTQGLISHHFTLEELFAPNTFDRFVV